MTEERPTEYFRRVYPALGTNAAIRKLAERMAQELDVHVDRAERAIRNLLALELLEHVSAGGDATASAAAPPKTRPEPRHARAAATTERPRNRQPPR